jgi:hypothetical protein
MRVHAVQTGTVAIRERQRKGEGRGALRLLKTALGGAWTEPLPIWSWVIEHPEGVIVVDTGVNARMLEPGYFTRWNPYFRRNVRVSVRPEEEIGPRLRGLGIATTGAFLTFRTPRSSSRGRSTASRRGLWGRWRGTCRTAGRPGSPHALWT